MLGTRDILDEGLAAYAPDEPFSVVINAFQPATALGDLSDPVDYVDRAIGVTARVLAEVATLPCVKVVYTSSASVYGDRLDCREDGSVSAGSLHAGLKLANEELVRGVCSRLDIDHTVVRLFNMYGGEDEFSVVAKMIAAARTGSTMLIANHGNAIRDFIHVDDVVRCYARILRATGPPVINVASGVGVSVRTVIDAVRLHGIAIPTTSVTRAEIRFSTADVGALRQLIDPDGFISVIDHVVAEIDEPGIR